MQFWVPPPAGRKWSVLPSDPARSWETLWFGALQASGALTLTLTSCASSDVARSFRDLVPGGSLA